MEEPHGALSARQNRKDPASNLASARPESDLMCRLFLKLKLSPCCHCCRSPLLRHWRESMTTLYLFFESTATPAANMEMDHLSRPSPAQYRARSATSRARLEKVSLTDIKETPPLCLSGVK